LAPAILRFSQEKFFPGAGRGQKISNDQQFRGACGARDFAYSNPLFRREFILRSATPSVTVNPTATPANTIMDVFRAELWDTGHVMFHREWHSPHAPGIRYTQGTVVGPRGGHREIYSHRS
jgi:hypothetical protein